MHESFTEEMITVLQTLADQLAVALNNAHLFSEAQSALAAERRAYGEMTRVAWQQMFQERDDRGYVCDQAGVMVAGGEWSPEMYQAFDRGLVKYQAYEDNAALAVPIHVRGQAVGVLNFQKSDSAQTWSPEEIDLVETLADQLGLALESARLYEDTQRRAAREQMIGEIASRMRETLELETVLNTAVREIGDALGLAALDVRLDVEEGA